MTIAGLVTVGTVWGLSFLGTAFPEGPSGSQESSAPTDRKSPQQEQGLTGAIYDEEPRGAMPVWLTRDVADVQSSAGDEDRTDAPKGKGGRKAADAKLGRLADASLVAAPGLTAASGSLMVSFGEQIPELSSPEAGTEELLRIMEHLPAQPPVVSPISSPYGWRIDPLDRKQRRRQFHKGTDFDVPEGTPVLAPAPGLVMSIQRGAGYGLYVKIKHEELGYMTLLGHLSRVAEGLETGKTVRRGQVVAHSGGGGDEDGRSTGPHVHFEIHAIGNSVLRGDPVDPAAVFDLYWEAWDAVQGYPLAKTHASYAPYLIVME